MIRMLLGASLVALLLLNQAAAQEAAAKDVTDVAQPTAKVDDAMAAKYEKFTELLNNVQLVGKFTMVGRDIAPPNEQYDIKSVKKLPEGDYWLINATIKYGKTNLTVPLKLEVKWAGDTPMITLTDFNIPTLGTFSSRVMFYNNKYAGTWTHGKVHGHMFGVIKKVEAEKESEASD